MPGPAPAADPRRRRAPVARTRPRAVPAGRRAERFAVMPHLEALAIVKGEHVCRNEDLIRNTAYSWSPMTAEEIREKTGIETAPLHRARARRASALQAATSRPGGAPAAAGGDRRRHLLLLHQHAADPLGRDMAVRPARASSRRTCSCDLVAACAGFPYGLGEAVRLLQDVQRPVLAGLRGEVLRQDRQRATSRMIFGDGAAAMVVGPAAEGEPATWRSSRPTPAGRRAR